MGIETLIAFHWFSGLYVAAFMLAGAIFFLLDSLMGPKRYPLWFVRAFFIGWNLVVAATIHFIWKYGVFMLATA